jgi:outer membrane receptor protein involved in Fe transport
VASIDVVGIAPLPGLGIASAQLPYPVQMLDAGAAAISAGQNLGQSMARQLTGVGVNEVSGSPFQNDLTFHGYRASPVLGAAQGISVYLDGVRVNEPFGDVINWDMLPEAAVRSVLLVPGSNPLYGLNTLGGAIALTTKDGRRHPGMATGLSLANNGQRRADAEFGYDSGRGWNAFVAATAFHDRGWRDRSDGRLGNLYAKLAGTVGSTDWNVAWLTGSSRLIGNGLLPDELYQQDRRAVYTSPDRTANRLRQLAVNATRRLGAEGELSATAYLRNSRRDAGNGDINDDYVEGADAHPASWNTATTRQTSRGLSVQWSGTLPMHQLTVGSSIDHSRVSFAQYTQDAYFSANRGLLMDPFAQRDEGSSVSGNARNGALYAIDTWALAQGVWLTASARYGDALVTNQLRRDAQLQPRESFRYRIFNPALGVAHYLRVGWTLSANLSQSNRVPTVIELGCADPDAPCRLPVGLQSDPYLKQVVARTVEAAVRWQGERGAAALLSLYRTINRDDILFHGAGKTQQGYFSNFARTRHQGLDMSVSSARGPLAAHLSYSYLDAVYDVAGELFSGVRTVHVTPGTRLSGLPRHSVKVALDLEAAPGLTLGANVNATSDLVAQGDEDGQGLAANGRVRGHLLLGLHVGYRPQARLELYARLLNATNRRYETFAAVAPDMFRGGALLASGAEATPARFVAPGAPRALAAGLRYRY